MGDTPITTDEGANIKASLKSEIRVPCFAHRCSTTLETAWEATRAKSEEFRHLTDSISELRAFIARSGGYQENLPKSIKKTSGTRPWRSYYDVNESGKFYFFPFKWCLLITTSRNQNAFSSNYVSLVLSSYDALVRSLSPVFEENRILSINKLLLVGVVDLMKKFVPIFDSMEFSQSPTLHNVVPSYYKMKRLVSPADQDRPTLLTLKEEIDLSLDEKYVIF